MYLAVIAILGTGVWNPTQGRAGDGRDWEEEDEVSLTTTLWESHRRKGRRQSRESWEPSTTAQSLQQRQSHVVIMMLLNSATMFS